jgi:hypothetical protein
MSGQEARDGLARLRPKLLAAGYRRIAEWSGITIGGLRFNPYRGVQLAVQRKRPRDAVVADMLLGDVGVRGDQPPGHDLSGRAMSKPHVSLRHRLTAAGIEILPAKTVPDGRIMWCGGRKVIEYGDLERLKGNSLFPRDADTVCLSPADFAEVMEDEAVVQRRSA